jgi:hypothetical protein
MKAAIALVDELLMGPAANDPKVRQSLVKLRQLLSESPDRAPAERRRSSSRSTDKVEATKKEVAGSTVSGYERSSEGSEEYLNEMRPSHPPFRVAKRLFSVAVRVMKDARHAMTFEEWRAAMLKVLDEKELPEYLLRVIVRFLRSRGMLVKSGVRYSPPREYATDFVSTAESVWSRL